MEENLHPPSFGQRRERGKRNEVRGKKIKIPLFSPHTSTLSPLVPLSLRTEMPDQIRHDGKEKRPRKWGLTILLTSVPVFREDRDPG